jgi:hypothetical protein
MVSRFRTDLTTVPKARIKVTKQGFVTTIGRGGGNIKGRALQQIGDPRLSGPLPTDPFLIPGTRVDYGGGNVPDMTSPGLGGFKHLLMETRRREQQIKAEIRKAKWQLCGAWAARALGWISLASVVAKPIRERARKALAVRRSEMTMLGDNLAATRVSVDFDMDSEIAEPHRMMLAAFDRMASSQRTWSVQTTQRIDRVRARSWAGTVMSREPTIFQRLAASLVDTQDMPLAMRVLRGRSTAYFYPGFVLVDGGRGTDFALIDVAELGITSAAISFTETEAVPSDAGIIGSTWAKANKNGSRDRRFAHNRELPIMRYGCLNLSSVGGMNEAYMFSNADAGASFVDAVDDLKRVLARGRAGRRIENRPLLDRPR